MKHELEFSAEQCERIDEIHNAVFELCKVLTEKEDLEWNMEYIGEIAETACDILVDQGFKIRYPVRVTSMKDGTEYITDWHNEELYKRTLQEMKNADFATETHDSVNKN